MSTIPKVIYTFSAQATKEKTYRLDFIKIKNFCASKDSVNKVKT